MRSTFQAAQQALFNAKSLMLVKFIINPVNLPVVLLVDEGELAAACTDSHLPITALTALSSRLDGRRVKEHFSGNKLPLVSIVHWKKSLLSTSNVGCWFRKAVSLGKIQKKT